MACSDHNSERVVPMESHMVRAERRSSIDHLEALPVSLAKRMRASSPEALGTLVCFMKGTRRSVLQPGWTLSKLSLDMPTSDRIRYT